MTRRHRTNPVVRNNGPIFKAADSILVELIIQLQMCGPQRHGSTNPISRTVLDRADRGCLVCYVAANEYGHWSRREAQQEDTLAKVPAVLRNLLIEDLSRSHRVLL